MLFQFSTSYCKISTPLKNLSACSKEKLWVQYKGGYLNIDSGQVVIMNDSQSHLDFSCPQNFHPLKVCIYSRPSIISDLKYPAAWIIGTV